MKKTLKASLNDRRKAGCKHHNDGAEAVTNGVDYGHRQQTRKTGAVHVYLKTSRGLQKLDDCHQAVVAGVYRPAFS